ncbi:hypothetical protein C4568_04070 [Candidatus Parcubacteria bacterium]|nr:MAG: hypothetical protein C4568_04070 [Candidatus Parcubacteria bacterium]
MKCRSLQDRQLLATLLLGETMDRAPGLRKKGQPRPDMADEEAGNKKRGYDGAALSEDEIQDLVAELERRGFGIVER